jgi:acyl-CoA thioester hydrolase
MNPSEPVLLNEATVRIGWVDAATMRPSRIPATILERIA